MLLVIHNLPGHTKYADVKALLQSKCGLKEVILDNLSNEAGYKRVTVGLADDGDGAILVRKINGLYIEGKQLYVEDVRQKKDSEQPYRSSQKMSMPQNSFDDYSLLGHPQKQNVQDLNPVYQCQDENMMYNMAAMGGVQFVPIVQAVPLGPQNSYMGYGGQQQQQQQLMPQAETGGLLEHPYGYSNNARDSIVDWGSNNNRHIDRSRPSFEEPLPRERPDVLLDRRQPRWDEPIREPRESRRRSRSPGPEWITHDRIDNRQNRFDNYREDPAPMPRNNEPRNYDRGSRNMAPSNSNFGAPRNMNPSDSNFGAPRNMEPSISRFGGPRNNSNFGNSRTTDFHASNFRDSEPFIQEPSSNIYGNHVMQSAPRWNQDERGGNRFDNEPLQPQRGGRDFPKQRGDNNPQRGGYTPQRGGQNPQRGANNPQRGANNPQRGANNPQRDAYNPQRGANNPQRGGYTPQRGGRNPPPSREMSKPFGSRGSNQGGTGPSRNFENRRDEPRGPVKRGNSKWDDGAPQAKKFVPSTGPRPQNPSFGKLGPKIPNAPNPRRQQPETENQQISLEKLMNKDETWRGQAASSIAKEMTKNLDVELPLGTQLFTHLKQSIRARINVMLKDKIMERLQIMQMYTAKFPPEGDQEFFLTVVNDLKEKEAQKAAAEASGAEPASNPKQVGPAKVSPLKPGKAQGPKPGKPSAPGSKPGQPAKQAGKKPAPKPMPKKEIPLGKGRSLPNFPGGDKIAYKKIKAEERNQWREDNYKLPEDLQKALEVEVDTLCDIFMSECMNPANDYEKPVCEQIADIVSDDFRKTVRIHVTRRLLNDAKNIVIRVHGMMRAPQLGELDRFLMKYGCIALQKSDRQPQLFLAHFNSFKNADKVIALGTATIDGTTVAFKPFQASGPPASAKEVREQHQQKLNNYRQSFIDKSKENILQPGYVYDPKAGKDGNISTDEQNKNSANKIANEAGDNDDFDHAEAGDNYFDDEDVDSVKDDAEADGNNDIEDVTAGGNNIETVEIVDTDDENPGDADVLPDYADNINEDVLDDDDLEDY